MNVRNCMTAVLFIRNRSSWKAVQCINVKVKSFVVSSPVPASFNSTTCIMVVDATVSIGGCPHAVDACRCQRG
jgi:hypothetical protein